MYEKSVKKKLFAYRVPKFLGRY